MTYEPPSSRSTPRAGDGHAPPRMGCAQPLGAALLAGFIVTAGVVGLLVGRCSQTPSPKPAASVTVLHASPNVVRAISDLARLEGATFHMERVIDLKEKQNRLFGLVQTEDALLLVAAGDVTAGVDLSKLSAGDVQVDPANKTAKVTLPAPEVFSSRLDNERTYVHTRNTDVLAKRRESLETQARREAERSLQEAALEAGILPRAERNAKQTVESLVRSLGYDQVTVSVRAARER